jgi:ATP-dependent DNA helicase RecG
LVLKTAVKEVVNLSLDSPLADVPFLTASVAAALAKGCKLKTVSDLLRHFPRRYEDRRTFTSIMQTCPGGMATISGKIVAVENVPTRSRMVLTKVSVRDKSGTAQLVFFNQWYLKKQMEKLIGKTVAAYGKVQQSIVSRGIELTDVEWEMLDDDETGLSAGRIVPVYPGTEGISQNRLRKIMWMAVDTFATMMAENLPGDVLARRELMELTTSYRQIHFPDSDSSRLAAERRFAFDQFFGLQLLLAARRRQLKKLPGTSFSGTREAIDDLSGALSFSMTAAQSRVVDEVATDMALPLPMNRLVQGDVGAGKTVIAMAAILIAVRNGYQASMMAPTEILAEQHFLTVHKTMERLGVKVALLTGSSNPKQKPALLTDIASGTVDVVIGTHALIQQEVVFKKLGLAVVDEQHRFGVLQRAALRDKGSYPDILVMTATPIPRTLTLTIYGDLDVSVIDQLPPRRKPIRTHWKQPFDRESIYERVRKMVSEGRQVYVVCALILESEKLQARAATELALHLGKHVFPEYNIGLMHGQLTTTEKEDVMELFREKKLHILVSTTVIEVGIDIANASVIVIEDADRFGLAQLHQLRGRVGRGHDQSYCILIADPKTEDGRARMKILESTNDGFKVAEEDLKLRGPGEFLGTRQSGLELLPFVDILRDVPLLDDAREEASNLLFRDPTLSLPEHIRLRQHLQRQYKSMAAFAGTN